MRVFVPSDKDLDDGCEFIWIALLLEALAGKPKGEYVDVSLLLEVVLEELKTLWVLQQGVQAPRPLQACQRRG